LSYHSSLFWAKLPRMIKIIT